MYFITEKDTQYAIKGSRDPLGLQVIWQNTGRKLIPYLSTVSNSITDFQILTLAFACKEYFKIQETIFPSFFIQLEQLMAYTRLHKNIKDAFNGVERAKKTFINSNKEIKISTNKTEQILSNQRNYGIWGKYNRPYSSLKLKEDLEIRTIYLEKINENKVFRELMKTFIHRVNGDTSKVKKEKLENFLSFIEKPLKKEKELFHKYILQDMFNYEISNILSNNSTDELNLDNEFNFYKILSFLRAKSENKDFIQILDVIKNTELTISPLNRIFRYLQKKSIWTKKEIDEDENISKLKQNNIDITLFENDTKFLANLHSLSNYNLVKGLQKRNETITQNRDSSSWINIQNENIEVNHFEGELFDPKYDKQIHSDFNYFFFSFLSLYKQLN